MIEPIKYHPTGHLEIDTALGGGLPAGRLIEIYGPESSGKTTLMLEIIAGVQKSGGIAAFVDVEHAFDLAYAQRLGVDPSQLLISQPDSGEQALEITDALVRSRAVDIIVIDSVAAFVPRAELEGEMGDHHEALARLMSRALRKLTSEAVRTGTTVVFINQLRHKIGDALKFYTSVWIDIGRNALRYYTSMRIDMRRVRAIRVGNKTVGSRICIKIVKNKLAPPFAQAEFDIMHGTGIR